MECGKTIDIGQVFWTYVNCKSASAKALGEIARFNESYRGIEITLDAYLENILALQASLLRNTFECIMTILKVCLSLSKISFK